MKAKFGKIIFYVLLVLSVLAGLLLVLMGAADRLNPVEHPTIATLMLAYPVAIIINLVVLALCLFLKPRLALVTVVAFILSFIPVRNYCPFYPMLDPIDCQMQVVSLNVKSWGMWKEDSSDCFIAEYLAGCNADVVCLQEANTGIERLNLIDEKMRAVYPYRDTAYVGKPDNLEMIYSKHPILRHENIPYESKNNHSTAFYLSYNKDTLLVVNNHFESNCLGQSDRDAFDKIVTGDVESAYAKEKSHSLFDKVRQATIKRAPQAEAVARYLDAHKQTPTILCGDFNDSPNSYAHYLIAQRLTDCYAHSGFGPGISYHEDHFYFRIDHIFCSEQFKPYRTVVDKNKTLSDHYPIITWFNLDAKD